MNHAKAFIKEARAIPEEYKGDTAVYLFTSNNRKQYRGPRDIWINIDSDAISYLKELMGEDNVRLVE